jgi:hypothetical protein
MMKEIVAKASSGDIIVITGSTLSARTGLSDAQTPRHFPRRPASRTIL